MQARKRFEQNRFTVTRQLRYSRDDTDVPIEHLICIALIEYTFLGYTVRLKTEIRMANPEHSDSAKVFMAGKSQAVRLPKKFRFAEGCDEVSIRKVGRSLILSPRFADWEDFWANTSPLDDDVVDAVLKRNDNVVEDPNRATFDE